MPTLDCTSLKTAVLSLSEILGTSPTELQTAWRTFRLNEPNRDVSPEDALIIHLGYANEAGLPSPTAIRWFHATRVPPATDFGEGILPTKEALPTIWEQLGRVAVRRGWVNQSAWNEFREGFWGSRTHGAIQFARKFMSRGWEGPFAFLVRSAATRGRGGGHRDFTRISEAAEDICSAFKEQHGQDLEAAYRDSTKRCLVTFTRPGQWDGAMSAALSYAYRAERRIAQSLHSNTCFSGEGSRVPPEWINAVEFL
jgi:hypothetical protein